MNQGYYGVHIPKLSSTNKFIIALSVAVFLVVSVLEFHHKIPMAHYIGLSPHLISKGFIYQFLTYPFYQEGLIALLFSSLILWFVGSELEGIWGSRYYIKLLLTANFCAGIFYYILAVLFYSGKSSFGIPLIGLTGSTYALLGVYAKIYKDRPFLFMMIFPMKAKYFCVLLVLIQLYMGVFSNYAATAWGHLAAMFFGFMFYQYSTKLSVLGGLSLKQKKRSRHLKLLKDQEGEVNLEEDQKNEPRYWQ